MKNHKQDKMTLTELVFGVATTQQKHMQELAEINRKQGEQYKMEKELEYITLCGAIAALIAHKDFFVKIGTTKTIFGKTQFTLVMSQIRNGKSHSLSYSLSQEEIMARQGDSGVTVQTVAEALISRFNNQLKKD